MSRRGENIRKRKDNRWEGRYIESYDENGKARYKSIYGKSYLEVKLVLTDIKQQLAKNNSLIQSGNLTFREVLYLWLKNRQLQLKPQTYAKYNDLIEKHITGYFGSKLIKKIDISQINDFLIYKSTAGKLDESGGISTSYLKTLIFIINSAFAFAAGMGYCYPLKGSIVSIGKRNKNIDVFSKSEQAQLERYIMTNLDERKIGILISLYTGLRIGEICGLRWEDIDFDTNTIHVRRTVEHITNTDYSVIKSKTKLILCDIKTGSSNRIVPIPLKLVPILKKFENLQQAHVLQGKNYLYTDPRVIQYSFRKYLDACNLRRINFHKFGLFALEDITAADGSVIPKDSLLETVSCDENGKAVFTFDLPVGAKAYVKEIATDEHYIVSDSIHEVSFTYAGQEVAVVEISVNNGEAFINEIARGTILGKKVDEDGFTIAGTVFGLFNENETVFTEETALLISMSNEIGVFTFENVPYGNWIVREIKPAPAFVLNENSYPVKVSENKEIVEITVTNRFIIGSVKVIKLDKENTDVRLTGVVFEVYVDVDGDKKYNPDIDILVGEMTETELGVYVMDELRYNGYFLHEKTAPVGYIADEGFHYFGIENDGETVIIEHEPGVGFTNNPKKGEFVLTKTDVADGKPLANVGFRIRDIEGKIVAEGYTDKNGEFRVTLRVGKYTYEEFSPLDGYVLNSEKYSFEIKENGDIVKAAMTNERIPQSGDNVNIRFRYGLLCIIALASIILLICSKRDKSNCFIK